MGALVGPVRRMLTTLTRLHSKTVTRAFRDASNSRKLGLGGCGQLQRARSALAVSLRFLLPDCRNLSADRGLEVHQDTTSTKDLARRESFAER